MGAQTYSISELAREFTLTPRTIRHYEEQGLLSPRREGANRVFSSRDRARLKFALLSARLGFPLSKIKELIELYELYGKDEQRNEFSAKLIDWRERLERQRGDIDVLLSEIEFFANRRRTQETL
jgi:DNA-binding transcriptional MerR regulator